jgi:hypothetical protein
MKALCALCHIPGLAVAAAIAVSSLPTPAPAQSLGRSYDIIAPEPWLPPRHRSVARPRKPSQPPGVPDYNRIRRSDSGPQAERIPKSVPLTIPQQPQPTFVPGVGTVPNLPPARGLGATETFNDRAARCAHQSGVFGVPPGQTGTYIRGCVN